MKKLLALFLFPMLAFGQATTGFHRVAQVIARAPLNSVTAQVVPYATVVLTNTATGVAAAVYSDPLLSVGIPNSTLTADGSGNYNYYFNLGVCVTETISSPNMGIIAIPNICSNGGGGGGSGTVTSVSCGNLNPLFNCSVTSPTTTPAIAYALQTASNFTFYGNFSGGTTAPSFWNLAAGSNVSLTPSGGNTLTIAATGGGSGTSQKWPILSWTGLQTVNSQVFASVMIAPAAGTIPSGCTGSASDTFPLTYTGGAVTYPVATGTPVFAVWDLNTTTNVCNITVSPSAHAGVPSGPGGSISIGDQLVVVGPSTIDSTYQNFDITLAVNVAGGGGGSGSVTQVNTGQGLNGGPITTTGTIACDTATTSQIGCVEPDGTIITVVSGAITVAKGSATAFGVLQCGSGTTCSGGVITATGSGIPYPSGTGIPQVTSGTSWGTTYNASNTIPANFVSILNQNTTGNAATATTLVASPSQCSSGDSPTGVAANGNALGCAPLGGSPLWSSLLNPTGNLALTMAANTTTFTFNSATGSSDLIKKTDGASNTGTGILDHDTTASGSSLTPWQADANGVGWQVTNTGTLAAVGSSSVHGLILPTGSAIAAASGKITLWSDSGKNRLGVTYNGGSNVYLASASGTAPSGDCAQFGTNGIDLADSGAPCGGGGSFQPSILPVPPAVSAFTSVNQVGSGFTTSNNGNSILMSLPNQGSLQWGILDKANAYSTPYSVASFWKSAVRNNGGITTGLYLYDGTKLLGIEFANLGGGAQPLFRVEHITNVTTDGSTVFSQNVALSSDSSSYPMPPPWAGGFYGRWRNNGTNLYADYSLDGSNWINFYSEAVGSFITPTAYGFGGLSEGSSFTVELSLQGWLETNSATL